MNFQSLVEILTPPNCKILDLSKLKAFADDKIIVTKTLKFDLGRVENVAKGENVGCQHFLLHHNVFKRLLSPGR